MNGEDKQRILNSADKEISRSKLNVPAQMFRRLLIKLNIDGVNYDRLIRTYLERTSDRKDPVSLASDRGNLNKALLADKMSWKTFIRGVEMLGVIKIKVSVNAYLPHGKWVSIETDEFPLRKANVPIHEQDPIDIDATEAEDED